ncbi:single-stranded-DNA-specific exonuclease RecJ [Peribacillus deserti]|uniref:Single-stranded-DNA-specific exonuclease RecJ n=1 Tax=Peribacillus deserti TaxID=673318 RepID=A0A2N5M991_9BACI|nr:single-stranded-DNA-specific exonuclease RecJ [Peribacillus deserti]PLT30883.1 single-stranded-DNA-specific exonuclease RecJ [Peribacillus deserti]
MLKSKTRWIVNETDSEIINGLIQQLNITPLVAKLLVNRGLTNTESARSFLFNSEEPFHDPFLFDDMGQAVDRIHSAIANKEKILIFGDYDADGVSSTSVLMITLKQMGADVDYYIPNRFTEGYGPNIPAFEQAVNKGFRLIITVDTGISAVKEAEFLQNAGVDYIITDHHEPGAELPAALAIIHPKLPGSNYPFKDLAGVGVAFKLAHALKGELPEELLDIASIGTIADLVPLFGENRLIAAKGIQKLRQTNRPGFLAMFKKANIKQSEINEESIGFGLAPRINAAGRLDSAYPAVELLLSDDSGEAESLAAEIDAMNKERQKIVSETVEQAVREVEEYYPPESNGILVIGKEGWNPGIVGIVASKLVDKFYRPAIVLSFDQEKGIAKGSARSIEGFDLFANLSKCRDILPHFGGHPMAAGMTLALGDVEELRTRLNKLAGEQLSEEDFTPITKLDSRITLEEITLPAIEELQMLAPFGMGNPKPRILIESVPMNSIKKIGADQSHLKIILDNGSAALDGVGFGLGVHYDHISPYSRVSVIGELSINEWNNVRKPQIFLADLSVSEWQLFDCRGVRPASKWLSHIPESTLHVIVFNENTLDSFNEDLKNKTVLFDGSHDNMEFLDGKNIVLFDMPKSSAVLEKLLKGRRPERIYAHFHQEQSHFFSTRPTREHFKWYYAFLSKRGTFDLKTHGDQLAKYRGWTKATVEFMSQVFFELEFVRIDNGLITLNKNVNKRELSDSDTYRQKQEQFELEQELLYSSYRELYDKFNQLIEETAVLEEDHKQWI